MVTEINGRYFTHFIYASALGSMAALVQFNDKTDWQLKPTANLDLKINKRIKPLQVNAF
jgi:hypothetical protein